MPTSKPKRPALRPSLSVPGVEDAATSRALEEVNAAVDRIPQTSRNIVVADLAVGDNEVRHGLGRKPRYASLTPTVANATFAWAMTNSDERQATISVVGVAQPGAALEFA